MPWWESEQGEFVENGLFGEKRFIRTMPQPQAPMQENRARVVINQNNEMRQSQNIKHKIVKPYIRPVSPNKEFSGYGKAISTIARPFTTKGRIERTQDKIKELEQKGKLEDLKEEYRVKEAKREGRYEEIPGVGYAIKSKPSVLDKFRDLLKK